MNGRLMWTTARWEMRLLLRGPSFWLGVLVSAAMAIHLARSGITNAVLMAYGIANWSMVAVPVLFLPVLGALRRRDEAAGLHELIQSRPIGGLEYVVGKFLAGWGALTATWATSMVLIAGVVTAVAPATLTALPTVTWLSGALLLPSFAFITALCAVGDVIWARTGAVLGVGTAVMLASWLYHPGLSLSNLVPMFVPRQVSPVFGFDPYTGAVLGNKGWTLSLTIGLLALTLLLLRRRSSLLHPPATNRIAAGLLAVAVIGGGLTGVALGALPSPGEWRVDAQDWELKQISRAAAGDAVAAQYWVQHADHPVEVWLAPGHDEAVTDLIRAAQETLPYFPGLAPADRLTLVEGSYIQEALLVGDALVLLPMDVTRGLQGRSQRSLIRVMAESYWSALGGRPVEQVPERWRSFLLDWHVAPRLYHQWVVAEQMMPANELAREIANWQKVVGGPGSKTDDDFWSSGAMGRSIVHEEVRLALLLWELRERLGTREILAALEEAAEHVAPVMDWTSPASFQELYDRYWAIVSDRLGVEITR